MTEVRSFDAKTIDLAGTNLIEASAGTGKTYSVALLVLRLIIKKDIPIKKILMVTFTKAAVAELESRIRAFTRQALKYSTDDDIENENIKEIIDQAGKSSSRPKLTAAVQSLDELSVMTIHSYCERSLMQYPFETKQSFKFDISTDISEIRDMVVNDYWRRKVTVLEPKLFRHFTRILTRQEIQNVVDKALDQKKYLCKDIEEGTTLEQISASIDKINSARGTFEEHIRDHFEDIRNRPGNKTVRKFIEDNTTSTKSFIEAYIKGFNKGTQYIEKSFPEEYALYKSYHSQNEALEAISNDYIYHIFKLAIEDLTQRITDYKKEKNIIDFNDQITLLHGAVMDGMVNEALSSDYDAVFIDEFQDTDKLQYEIFSELYSEKIMFYIGDPKQSIYGWRKADIATYKEARAKVDFIYNMNQNFRSTPELITALNNFFSIDDPFADTDIAYTEVEAGLHNLGSMAGDEDSEHPIEVFGFGSKPAIERFVVSKISQLLNSGEVMLNEEPITPSDIAIIVRTNREGRAMKKALSGANIPSITIDKTKVMTSDEAGIIQNLLAAVMEPKRESMNRVLLNACFGMDRMKIEQLDDEKHLQLFIGLKQTWQDSGVYNMLFEFFDLYQVRKFGMELGVQGQRTMTNFYHIAEILHETELSKKLSPGELIAWCKRSSDELNEENEQRVESQDDAVKITTIHKCKGLTYKVVFAPYLDLIVEEHPIYDFREDGSYKFTHTPDEAQYNLWNTQTEQENRRLIYVAMTRAQYKIYLCVNTFWKFNDSSLKKFPVQPMKTWEAALEGEPQTIQPYASGFSARRKPAIEVKNTFSIQSFSALSSAHYTAPFEKAEEENSYDQFIFQDLPRGASCGTALHSIFEHLDFYKEETWNESLQASSKYFPNIIKEDRIDLFMQMVSHVMKAVIDCAGEEFRLNMIQRELMLPEMEFYFSIDKVNRQVLNEVLGELAEIGGDSDLEGLMTGFIDLVFEQNDKYYILDWKSNHLGNSLDNYNQSGMEEAMKGSNYNLQYLIYTVALKRWLENRLPDFDYNKHFGGVVYVFLRGVREGEKTGFYTSLPSIDKIEKLDRALKS